ncbi:high choriolytic enzyme 1-like [Cheilinus undulatus]|uniref:high choriolytic enzyme 1-like n=1 Tax=Cheilinus undulatus TaxID=241271 RepID=UPI001BD5F9AE|nr:high choriolytic enzyme 1-like [Cheilinus undulatus]
MTPAFVLLLSLSLSAVSARAVNNEAQTKESELTDLLQTEHHSDVFENIERANNGTHMRLVQGDILKSISRNADFCTALGCKWEKVEGTVTVPVTLAWHQYNNQELRTISEALLSFHTRTCIRFKLRTNQRDYLRIFSGDGCYSYVGRQHRPQELSISRRGCVNKGTVQHELLHALGFHHEQARSDRDQYVNINWGNIEQGAKSQFQKERTNNLGTRYDYNSIMHYSRYAFSRNGRPTITAKGDPGRVIGAADEMSDLDFQRVNELYGCPQ